MSKAVKVDNLSDDESSFFSSSDDDEETKSGTRHLMSVDKDFKKMSISSSFTSQIVPPSIFDLDIESLKFSLLNSRLCQFISIIICIFILLILVNTHRNNNNQQLQNNLLLQKQTYTSDSSNTDLRELLRQTTASAVADNSLRSIPLSSPTLIHEENFKFYIFHKLSKSSNNNAVVNTAPTTVADPLSPSNVEKSLVVAKINVKKTSESPEYILLLNKFNTIPNHVSNLFFKCF